MKISTARFAQLLKDAQKWDECHQAMRHAQTDWLIENFIFDDELCAYASPVDRQKWDVAKVAGGRLYTICT